MTIKPATDGRVRRGNRTRRVVLDRAVDLASVKGLEGLAIGPLAADLQMSKSGLIALFGSKEGLQLATIRAARTIFVHVVIEPALQTSPGLLQVRSLMDAWLEYSSDRRFPGGCFFARALHEYAAQPGPVRDALASLDQEWLDLIAQTIAGAQKVGDILPEIDPTQLAFDLDSYLDSANLRSLLGRRDVYSQAKRAVSDRLALVAARR